MPRVQGQTDHTYEEVIEAVRKSRGIRKYAAAILGVHRNTILNYEKRWASVRAAFKEAAQSETDEAEFRLGALIRAGNFQAIKYRLGTKGKSRGWVERVEQEQVGKMVIEVVRGHQGSGAPAGTP